MVGFFGEEVELLALVLAGLLALVLTVSFSFVAETLPLLVPFGVVALAPVVTLVPTPPVLVLTPVTWVLGLLVLVLTPFFVLVIPSLVTTSLVSFSEKTERE